MGARTQRLFGRIIVVGVCGVSALLFSAQLAEASSVKPFGITAFSIGTTASTELVPVGTKYEYVTTPYTFTQAGGHPWALTVAGSLTTEEVLYYEAGHGTYPVVVPTADPRDIVVDLPPGLLGDPMAAPRCPLVQVLSSNNKKRCPASTQIGVFRLLWEGQKELVGPIVNVVPESGQSAEFAFETGEPQTPILTGHLVHTDQGYAFTVASNEIPELEIASFETTIWGVPADPSHDAMRGRICANLRPNVALDCTGTGGPAGVSETPFLTLPSDCAAGPETATVEVDSWEQPGAYRRAAATLPAATGCQDLAFDPQIEVQPDILLADEPVGLGINVRVPLTETPQSNATPQLRDTVVTLPEGLSVSPGVVDGIRACDEFGPEGINITGPESERVGPNGELQLAPGHCPDASIVGSAEAITPFLSEPVKGHIYLARPNCGGAGEAPCTEADAGSGKLYRLYLELGGTGALASTGVHFKVPLETSPNLATGQLTTRTLGTPQAPFSELKVRLNGGPRAPLANPAVCGRATTSADFAPWSAPGITPQGLSVLGTPDATPTSYFMVTGCPDQTKLAPGFEAGTVTPQAGKYSAFTMNLTRQDREPYVTGVQINTPPGLSGIIAGIAPCDEADANAGTCSDSSKIGTARVASGAGSHPFEIGGDVYFTGPYHGAPFGLSIVTHVVAGPFNLGTVVVRARIAVDPATAALTVTTDDGGAHPIPQIYLGVPLRLKRISVNVNRPNFMFNPTNCGAQHVTANISGSKEAMSSVSSPFAAGGCESLEFKPKFSASTSARPSRKNGASLDVKLAYPVNSLGKAANVARVKVSLPRLLPSRLSTLQHACAAQTFSANPAACPAASIVGIVRASTPLLPVGLSGPAYFVSHGGEAFPSIVLVLQGDNVRVDLTGTTFISKRGITSSTFETVPDVPVGSFELYLPQGRASALAANGDLCKNRKKLLMPTSFTAQNGLVFKQATRIAVSGCAVSRGKTARTGKRGG